MRHQASVSELKRSFMEAAPEPRPSQWEKRLTGSPAPTGLRPPVPGVRVLLRRDSRHRPCEPTRLHAALTLLSLFVNVFFSLFFFSSRGSPTCSPRLSSARGFILSDLKS